MKFKELPKDPGEAFIQVAQKLISDTVTFTVNTQVPVSLRLSITANLNILNVIARRLEDVKTIQSGIIALKTEVSQGHGQNVSKICEHLLEIVVASKLDAHFLDDEDKAEFEDVKWQEDDRKILFETLAEARKFAQLSGSFDDRQTRKILHYLSKVENEVLKPLGNFTTVIGSATQILDLVETAGNKGQPLAKLVETMRTTTKRNVTEHSKLEAPEEQKKLPSPEDD